MNEYDFIRRMAAALPRSAHQRNAVFECDAEVVEIDGRLWALTMDEFSPGEDLFTSDDPDTLGANLTTATLSDLLAAGATPQFFMHALSLPREADVAFADGLAKGIRSVLDAAGCGFCGGDMGAAETWRFCGFAMGPMPGDRAMTRVLPTRPQALWVTGTLGDANLAALNGSPTPRFELRLDAADLVRRRGLACIDTSGGFMEAVWLLHTVSPGVRIEIDGEALPLAAGLSELPQASGIPAEAALLGGAGEYELLFSLPEDESGPADATRIGAAQPDAEPGVCIRRDGEPIAMMSEPPPCPRDAATVADHVQDAARMARELFSG